MSNAEINTGLIKQEAALNGFDFCSIAKAQPLDDHADRLEKWLKQGMHGNMHYMENYFDIRIDPRKLLPGAKSVICLLKNYFPSEQPNQQLNISKYAYGKDYHIVIKDRLKTMNFNLQEKIGQFAGKGFVDAAPVLERAWAEKSGLGWIGRNGNLITKQSGSFFFIATLITDLDLIYDPPLAKDYCGNCKKCIEACPTEAILPDKTINGSKCISYFTIELKDELIPSKMKGQFENKLFGCDICQDVCPWNRFSISTTEKLFEPLPEILNFNKKDWDDLTEESFKKIFKNSPIKRTKFQGIKRNLKFLQE